MFWFAFQIPYGVFVLRFNKASFLFSDHAWGGNYFYAGGSVTGKRILGKYPSDLTSNSQLRFDPGVVIPTTSWDEFWELVAKWYGITADPDLTKVLPNRKAFTGLGNTF